MPKKNKDCGYGLFITLNLDLASDKKLKLKSISDEKLKPLENSYLLHFKCRTDVKQSKILHISSLVRTV